MRLFLTEKPSVARDLARALGAKVKHKTHIEGPGVWVAWCFGHLVEPAPPEAMDPTWRRWSAATLPMLPPQLHLQPIKRTRAHLSALGKLLKDRRVEVVVNACDAGREGELIFRYVYEISGCRHPVLRFWVSSLTQQAIQRGLQQLQPSTRFDPLADAARCRAEADWLVGMNATRALTLTAGVLLTVGRVQTPTLAMVVAREQEIVGFQPKDYWTLAVDLSAPGQPPPRWRAAWRRAGEAAEGEAAEGDEETGGRLATRAEAEALAARLRGRAGRVIKATRARQEAPPPQLHHLTSLQRLANQRFGMTAESTLKAAQALYERHKLITYPRTDARHLTRDAAQTLPSVLTALATPPYDALITPAMRAAIPALGRRFVDDRQVRDHHALIPTPKAPKVASLSRDEARIYDLIVRRTLAMLSPPAVYAQAVLCAEVEGERLEARGRTRLEAGWEIIEPRPSGAASLDLPVVEVGAPCHVEGAQVDEHTTQPPPRYTEATLLGAMERAGRRAPKPNAGGVEVDGAGLLEALAPGVDARRVTHEGGLGTPATRAATLETLLRRGYMARAGRTLAPLPAGEALVGAVSEALRSPALTSVWESRLGAIAAGEAPVMPFRVDLRDFTRRIVAELLNAPPPRLPAGLKRIGRGARPTAQATPSASVRAPSSAPASAPSSAPASTPSSAPASAPSSAPSSAPAPGWRAHVKPQRGSRRRREASTAAPATPPPLGAPIADKPIPCPRCQAGQIITGRAAWGCDRWREGCRFTLPFVLDGVTIPVEEARRLLRQGKSRLFATRGGRGARLVLDKGAEGRPRWARRGQP